MGTEKMNPEEIFNIAVEISDIAERGAYLDKVCREDRQLRAEVEALLKAHKEAGDFLEAPAFGANATLENSAMIEGPGTLIGRYKLLELIGEGGMGLVYLAEQQEPIRRKVALKIVKLGMDTKQVIARFEAERQALAVLDHPNIAHVYDAGATETGRPYFVMEYVKGISITKYCDERKLNIEQRLRLFEQVCEGVHYAHQKGIIHRDLKPSNILVSVHGDRAVPKIIDFGIAKAITQPLTDKSFVTFQDQLLGTPQYMSPEQVDMATQDIDTRSDIYSLGVVLYELLTGVLPFEKESFERAGFAEIQQTLRELEPASPSIRLTSLGEKAKAIAVSRGTQVLTLARRLHRELEWIPLKAMRKDRCRRYRSASELADDVRNYLNGLPLIAGPETAMYRVRKFVRKHAGSVTMVALIAVAIILGFVVSTAMYFRAEQARMRAENAEKVAQEQRKIAEQQRKLAETRAEDYRRSLYSSKIHSADIELARGNYYRANQLLTSCPRDLWGWEWYHLWQICHSTYMILGEHTGSANAAFSPDGKSIISGSVGEDLILWDAMTGTKEQILKGHSGTVYSVAFSPDGKKIVSGSIDGIVTVWDAETGLDVMTHKDHNEIVCSVAFSADNNNIASVGRNGRIKIRNAVTGKEVASFSLSIPDDEGGVGECKVVFSPDGKHIATSNDWDATIEVWDLTTGNKISTMEEAGDTFAFTQDGQFIISYDWWGNILKWNWAKGIKEVLFHIRLLSGSTAAFSADGKYFAQGHTEGEVEVWDLALQKKELAIRIHNRVRFLAFNPDSTRILSGDGRGTICIWEFSKTDKVKRFVSHDMPVLSVAVSPDNSRIVSAEYGKISVWDIVEGKEIRSFSGDGIVCVDYSPISQHIVSVDRKGKVKLWDVSEEAKPRVYTMDMTETPFIRGVTFSPDGRYIMVASTSWKRGKITILDVTTVEPILMFDTPYQSGCPFFSPDGRSLVSGNRDTIKTWDATTGAELLTLNSTSIGYVRACIGNGRYIASNGNVVTVWDVKAQNEIISWNAGDRATTLISSPDGRRVVSSSYDSIKIWDATTGEEILTLDAQSRVLTVVFSPDGKLIVAGCEDGSIKIWDSAGPEEVPDKQTKSR